MNSVRKKLLQEANYLTLVDGRVESTDHFSMVGQRPSVESVRTTASQFSDIGPGAYPNGVQYGSTTDETKNFSGPYEKTGDDVKYKMNVYGYPDMSDNRVFPVEFTKDLRLGDTSKDTLVRLPVTQDYIKNDFKYSCDYFNGTQDSQPSDIGWQRSSTNNSQFGASATNSWSSDLGSLHASFSVHSPTTPAADIRYKQIIRVGTSQRFMYYKLITSNGNISTPMTKYNVLSFFLKKQANTNSSNTYNNSFFMVRLGRLSLPGGDYVARNIDELGAHYLMFNTNNCRLVHGENVPKVNYINGNYGQLEGEIVDRIHYEDYPNGWTRIYISTKEWYEGVLVGSYTQFYSLSSIPPNFAKDNARAVLQGFREAFNNVDYTFHNASGTTIFNNMSKRTQLGLAIQSEINQLGYNGFGFMLGHTDFGYWHLHTTDAYRYANKPVYMYHDYTPRDEVWNSNNKLSNGFRFRGLYQRRANGETFNKITILVTLVFGDIKNNYPISGGLLMRWPYITGKQNDEDYRISIQNQGGGPGVGYVELKSNETHTLVMVVDRDVNPENPGNNFGQWPIYYRGKKYITNYGPFPDLDWMIYGRTGREFLKEFAIWERVLTDEEIFAIT